MIEEVFFQIRLDLHSPDVFNLFVEVLPKEKRDSHFVMTVTNRLVQLLEHAREASGVVLERRMVIRTAEVVDDGVRPRRSANEIFLAPLAPVGGEGSQVRYNPIR